jgi:hypothetical protein
MMTVRIGPLVAADANLARRGRREPQFQGFSNRMLDTTVALMNAK